MPIDYPLGEISAPLSDIITPHHLRKINKALEKNAKGLPLSGREFPFGQHKYFFLFKKNQQK